MSDKNSKYTIVREQIKKDKIVVCNNYWSNLYIEPSCC